MMRTLAVIFVLALITIAFEIYSDAVLTSAEALTLLSRTLRRWPSPMRSNAVRGQSRPRGLGNLGKSRARRLALELDTALLLNRCLLDRDHLSLHLGQFGRRLLIATDEDAASQKITTAAAVVQPSFVC